MTALLALIPSKAKLYAALAIAGAVLLAILKAQWKASAIKDAVAKAKEKDLEHANEIEDRVEKGLADDERFRRLDDAGWRD